MCNEYCLFMQHDFDMDEMHEYNNANEQADTENDDWQWDQHQQPNDIENDNGEWGAWPRIEKQHFTDDGHVANENVETKNSEEDITEMPEEV